MNDEKSNFDDGAVLSLLVRRARRRTILRNISISFGITLFILTGGWFLNLQLQYRSSDNTLRDIEMLKAISGPNQYVLGSQFDYGFLHGTLDYRTYKLVEGVPVIWGEETYEFSSWGSFSRPPGDYSDLQLPDPVMKEKGFKYERPFNRYNGEREMMFYLPLMKYENYLNELPKLNEMDEQKLVELGISLDTNYTVKQIESMLPNGVHPVWYWVDTYSTLKPYTEDQMPEGTIPERASSVYGFGIHPKDNDVSEKNFIEELEDGIKTNGKYQHEFERIYDYLRRDKEKPDTSDVRILGVVVTGTADSLKALQEQKYVKAAVLGAIVDK